MVFKAKNSANGVSIEGDLTAIESITGRKTESEGVVIISKEKSVYIPNFSKDTLKIIDKVGQSFLDLAGVPPITGSGPSTALNPQFALKLTELGNNIKALSQEVV